jgi:hypothetical protein
VIALLSGVDYTNLFAPTRTEILAALGAVVPIAVGIFAVILGIRIGVSLFNTFLGGEDVEEE